MRKRLVGSIASDLPSPTGMWLPLEEIATVEVASEDVEHPIESALLPNQNSGWRAGMGGPQTIRLVFDRPLNLRRVQLCFQETSVSRTQECVLRWSSDPYGPGREIVRQRWNFSPRGSTTEIEDYTVDLRDLIWLELTINPDVADSSSRATLASMRVA